MKDYPLSETEGVIHSERSARGGTAPCSLLCLRTATLTDNELYNTALIRYGQSKSTRRDLSVATLLRPLICKTTVCAAFLF